MTSLTRVRAGGVRLIRSRRGRIWMLLAIAGPGVVAANAGNDAAGIATYASAGSQFVYRTLFFMVLVTFALVLVQEMSVRLGTHTGKGLAALIREEFSLRLTGVALFCVLLANTGLVVSEFAAVSPALSPDGKRFAYVSNESGTLELYVRPFNADAARAFPRPDAVFRAGNLPVAGLLLSTESGERASWQRNSIRRRSTSTPSIRRTRPARIANRASSTRTWRTPFPPPIRLT